MRTINAAKSTRTEEAFDLVGSESRTWLQCHCRADYTAELTCGSGGVCGGGRRARGSTELTSAVAREGGAKEGVASTGGVTRGPRRLRGNQRGEGEGGGGGGGRAFVKRRRARGRRKGGGGEERGRRGKCRRSRMPDPGQVQGGGREGRRGG